MGWVQRTMVEGDQEQTEKRAQKIWDTVQEAEEKLAASAAAQ